MIYITGDTHIPVDIQKLSTKRFPEQKEMTKNDYVIICGDFGGVWDDSNEEKYWIKWLKNKNFTTLFIDGNHENFDMLYSLPIVDFCGGTAHKVDNGIYHLIRGEIYTIDEKNSLSLVVPVLMIKIVELKEKIGGRLRCRMNKNMIMQKIILKRIILKSTM